jgi:hypothetical protein
MFGETQYPSCFHVLVMFMDIGIGVMEHVVLHLPIVNVASKNVNAASHDFIDPFLIGIRSMIAIMHNVHAHTGHANAHDNGEQYIGPSW